MRQLTKHDICELLSDDVFRLLSETADGLGLECYLVGGYVRDLFLERATNDIDVVVVGSGIAMAKAFARRVGKRACLSVFKNFGTAQVKIYPAAASCNDADEPEVAGGNAVPSDCLEVEFVGARKESYSHNSRKPVVENGTLEDDQNRRDFTINALAVCLNGPRFGELVDPFGGLDDMADGIIRTPLDPDITFSDDPLRMMRCIRFAAQLRFMIDDVTFEAIRRNRKRIGIVSGERVIEEINKIMLTKNPSVGFVEMHRCGLLSIVLPELSALDAVEERNGRKHKNNFYHTLEVVDNVAKNSSSLWLRWAALLHDIGKPKSKRWDQSLGWTFHNHNFLGAKMVRPLFKRLKLPLDERMKYVEKLVNLHMRPIVIADEEVSDSAVRRLLFEAGNDIDDLMCLCEADITSKNEVRKRNFLDNFRLVREKLVAIEEKDRIRNFQPPVDGVEIMARYGLQPCREIGVLKTALKDAILDGVIPNEHDEALEYIRKVAASMGLKEKETAEA